MGALRVNGTTFQLPEILHGRQFIVTARKREKQFVDVMIMDTRFEFDHPIMKRMLSRFEDPTEGEIADIVNEEVQALRRWYESAVI